MDGKWAGEVVDHICKYLIQYAIQGDQEAKQKKGQEMSKDGEYVSAHERLEKTQVLLQTLFRKMSQMATNQAPDNRVFCVFFVSLRAIKVSFKMNNFKHSDSFFKWIYL